MTTVKDGGPAIPAFPKEYEGLALPCTSAMMRRQSSVPRIQLSIIDSSNDNRDNRFRTIVMPGGGPRRSGTKESNFAQNFGNHRLEGAPSCPVLYHHDDPATASPARDPIGGEEVRHHTRRCGFVDRQEQSARQRCCSARHPRQVSQLVAVDSDIPESQCSVGRCCLWCS